MSSKYLCRSSEKITNIDFTFVIDDFVYCKEDTGEGIRSSVMPLEQQLGQWTLVLLPKGKHEDDCNYVSLFLHYTPATQEEISIKATFSVVHGKDMVTRRIKTMNQTYPGGVESSIGYQKFLERSAILHPQDGLLISGKLLINCQLVLFGDRVNVLSRKVLVPNAAYKYNPLDGFGEILESGKFSDVTLCVEGKELRAHTAILAAKSKVFTAMFSHEMVEQQQNSVEIPDITYEVLTALLLFMYTGKCPNLEKFPKDLLIAADKYDIPVLKQKCGRRLISSINVENVVDLLILADKYSVQLLKSEAMNFIQTCTRDVMNGPGWTAILHHPIILDEICRAILPVAGEYRDRDSDPPDPYHDSNPDHDSEHYSDYDFNPDSDHISDDYYYYDHFFNPDHSDNYYDHDFNPYSDHDSNPDNSDNYYDHDSNPDSDHDSNPDPAHSDHESNPDPDHSDHDSNPDPAHSDHESNPDPDHSDHDSNPDPGISDHESNPDHDHSDHDSNPDPDHYSNPDIDYDHDP